MTDPEFDYAESQSVGYLVGVLDDGGALEQEDEGQEEHRGVDVVHVRQRPLVVVHQRQHLCTLCRWKTGVSTRFRCNRWEE